MNTPASPQKSNVTRSTASHERYITVHPRISTEDAAMLASLSDQFGVTKMSVLSEAASAGLLLVLLKMGPNEHGLFGGRWTAKELAQIIRRKWLNLLLDFQMEQGELPSIFQQMTAALFGKFESPSREAVPPVSAALSSFGNALTEADKMVFSATGDAESFQESLGSMGFQLLHLSDE